MAALTVLQKAVKKVARMAAPRVDYLVAPMVACLAEMTDIEKVDW